MESVIVNARIPQATKDAAASILQSLGATPSELINSAYSYLLEHGSLPGAFEEENANKGSFQEFVEKTRLEIDWSSVGDSADYKQILREGKLADYESLA